VKTIKVKDLMVPLEEYATVPVDASLFDAVMALEKAQEELDRTRHHYLHRAVLVMDKDRKVIGKISQMDAIKGLEPKYRDMGDPHSLSRAGFSADFLLSMLQQYSLWDQPLADLCSKATEIRVVDFMHTPTQGEYIREEASLEEAIHMLLAGRHHSLLVTRGDEIVGVLKLTDVFNEIFQRMKTCNL